MEGKREMFWKQGDFGYVKDVVDSLVVLCKPKSKVWSAVEGGATGCSVNSSLAGN